MENTEKIIVSFTSWTKRINYVAHVVNLMKEQTLKPYKIILNLSKEEFPNCEINLPSDLVKMVDDCFIINWVNENTKVWKKFIPVLNMYPNDVIIPIDDDIEYPKNYIQEMYNGYLKYNKECPIVCFENIRKNNVLSHSGPFSLVKKEFFGDYLDDIYTNLICKHKEIHWQSDEVYSYAMWLNGKRYKSIKSINAKDLYSSSVINKIDAYSNYSKGFSELMIKIRELLAIYIKNKYKKEYDDLFKTDIIVSFTTWKKRDEIVPIMLENFAKQVLKPNKIICWLSSEEYNNKIPEHLLNCKKRGLLDEIRFVDGHNTFAHKRWEVLKEYNGKYNIMIDDDILYETNYIKDLYNSAVKNQGCANIWCSNIDEFNSNKCYFDFKNKNMKSRKLQTLSGLSCYPPYTLSNIIFKNIEMRDKWCKRCDDSWIRSCIIKDKIDIVRVYERQLKTFKTIDGTQENGVWNTDNKLISKNGVRKIYENLSNAIVINDAIKEAKEIWPNFDVYRCCNEELLKSIGIEKDMNTTKKEEKQGVAKKQLVTNELSNNRYQYDEPFEVKPKHNTILIDGIYDYHSEYKCITSKLKRRRELVKKKQNIDNIEEDVLIYQRI